MPLRRRPTTPSGPGRWAAEPSWPSPNVAIAACSSTTARLGEKAGDERPLAVRGAQVAGQDAGEWCAFGRPLDAPPDQRGRGRLLALLHLGAAHRAARDPRVPRRPPRPRLRSASSARRRAAVRRQRDGRVAPCCHERSAQPHPPQEPRAPRAHGPRGAHRRLGRAAVHRPGGPGRPPLAGRHLAHVLPLGLALAGPRHPHRVLGCELARAARARLEPARRWPAAPRPAGGRPEDRDRGARGGDRRGPDHERSPHREDRVAPARLAGARPASGRARDVRLARFLLLDHRGRPPLGPLPRRQDGGARPRQLGDPPRRRERAHLGRGAAALQRQAARLRRRRLLLRARVGLRHPAGLDCKPSRLAISQPAARRRAQRKSRGTARRQVLAKILQSPS